VAAEVLVVVAVLVSCVSVCTQGAELTQDYTNSDYHRFRNPDSNNHLHIHPPSATLHISNLPSVAARLLATAADFTRNLALTDRLHITRR